MSSQACGQHARLDGASDSQGWASPAGVPDLKRLEARMADLESGVWSPVMHR
jgi:hypothetical protein